MEELNNTILIVFIVLIVSLGAFFGSVATSSSANDTNVTNNTTNNTSKEITLAARGAFPSVSLDVTSSVDLGTQVPDGSEISYPSFVQVNASAWELFPQGDNLNVYVRASGDFISGSNNIALSNFKYDGFSNSNLTKTSFTTTNTRIQSWPMGNGLVGSITRSVYGNYYMTIPMGSAEGTYTTTIYYTAILE